MSDTTTRTLYECVRADGRIARTFDTKQAQDWTDNGARVTAYTYK
jgi:hypothetical protein